MNILLIFTRVALVVFAGVVTFFHIAAATASLQWAFAAARIGPGHVPIISAVPFVGTGFSLLRLGFAFVLIVLPLVAIYFAIRFRKNSVESSNALLAFALFLAGAMPAIANFWDYRGPFYLGLAVFALVPLGWSLRRYGEKFSARRFARGFLAPLATGALATIIVWTAAPPHGYSGMTVQGNASGLTVTYSRSNPDESVKALEKMAAEAATEEKKKAILSLIETERNGRTTVD